MPTLPQHQQNYAKNFLQILCHRIRPSIYFMMWHILLLELYRMFFKEDIFMFLYVFLYNSFPVISDFFCILEKFQQRSSDIWVCNVKKEKAQQTTSCNHWGQHKEFPNSKEEQRHWPKIFEFGSNFKVSGLFDIPLI